MFRNKYTTCKTTLIYRPVFKCIKMGIIDVSTFETTLIYRKTNSFYVCIVLLNINSVPHTPYFTMIILHS